MLRKSFSLCLILIIFLGLLFFNACAPNPNDGTQSKRDKKLQEVGGFLGGTEGLRVSLVDGAPPKVIQDSGLTPFSFIVTLENAGESDVGPDTDNPTVFARLTGIMYRNFDLREQDVVKRLDAKLASASRNFEGTILPGEINFISFDDLTYLPDVFDSIALTIRGEVCYDYENIATVKFCMKKDVLESWEDASICTLSGDKPVGNSGGPIHVTRVEEAPINRNMIQLNFVIEHLGTGVFFSRDERNMMMDMCWFDELNPEIYALEVFIEPIQENTYSIECMRLDNHLAGGGAHGKIKMFMGAPLTLTCFLTNEAGPDVRVYEDLLNVRLRYRYGEFIEAPILIQSHP
ncbi:MAG: hypothetical protein KKF46_00655 [Nanoarchaeota archaeon]|nr:hypothetical protein [Nanoarchaeota archaeon]MBU1320845.1 hypothetical protein [Nanoarchaeota archaeon]MBU1597929.1 hypothetical protein [Nanoarchaeota archaeon]MBU2440935.1 hypothetical protein [Nanoarchaeota archaeon]